MTNTEIIAVCGLGLTLVIAACGAAATVWRVGRGEGERAAQMAALTQLVTEMKAEISTLKTSLADLRTQHAQRPSRGRSASHRRYQAPATQADAAEG